MTNFRKAIWALVLSAAMVPVSAAAECADQPGACKIEAGSYELQLPAQSDSPAPVVIFLHGYGGNGKSALKSEHIAGPILRRGYAVIAPNALRRDGSGPRAWNFHPDFRTGRDEYEFIRAVLADAAANHNLDTSRVLLSGFSIGGSMAAYIACEAPGSFHAYAPVGGNVWRPHPTSCAAPVKMFHTHGWTDSTVPLEGRVVGSGFTQGDVFHALGIWRQSNRCDQPRANVFSQTGMFMRRAWTNCAPGSALEFALFPGGHTVPEGWADMALDWFEKHVPPVTN